MNGIQAMDGVHDRPRQLTVDLGTAPEGGALLVVSDRGPGIDPKTMGHLFDAFYTTKTDGMGMGLSISRSIVEAHGGRIWATNGDGAGAGAGARLHVSLPALQEQQT
jgi:signal transduction histidine kinase